MEFADATSTNSAPPRSLATFVVIGFLFGIVLIKSEVASWFRIQEMFRFDSFHMYGVIGCAMLVGSASVWLIKRFNVRAVNGDEIRFTPKEWRGVGTRYWLGGSIFGMGWALLGACPGPIFSLAGGGMTVMFVGLAAAIAGTWSYGYIRDHLPH